MELSGINMPGTVYCGQNALDMIPAVIGGQDVKRIAVFTDKAIQSAGLLDQVLRRTELCGGQTSVQCDLSAEPSYRDVQRVVDECRKFAADLIIAVGGGSVMDTAKLTGVLLKGRGSVKELLTNPGKAAKSCLTMMIPTTAGTGAEATPNAIVTVPEKELKVGIVSKAMIADCVILDPEMVKNLSAGIAAATGIDALAHAIECYTGSRANPVSDTFALEALDMILNHILPACTRPEALAEKSRMQLASFYAGLAITASGTTAVHALSYPLGGKYRIPHGVANAMLLSPVLHFNEAVCRARFAAAYDRCVLHDGDRAGKECPEAEKSRLLLEWIDRLVRKLAIPSSLKAFAVTENDLDALVDAALQVTRLLGNNRRPVNAADARAIYRQIM